jgi:hypothetical protein
LNLFIRQLPCQHQTLLRRPEFVHKENRLGEDFIQALASNFGKYVSATIEQVRKKDPTAYRKLVQARLPREILLQSLRVNATVNLNELAETRGRLEAYKYARDLIGAPLIEAEPIGA